MTYRERNISPKLKWALLLVLLFNFSSEPQDYLTNPNLKNHYSDKKSSLIYPLARGSFKKSSGFGFRKHPLLKEELFHYGVDLAAKNSMPVFSIIDGKVISVGESYGRGNYLEIRGERDDTSFTSLFYHLDTTLVEEGQKIDAGDLVARVGSTGLSTDPHLHFGLEVNGKHVNPEGYFSFKTPFEEFMTGVRSFFNGAVSWTKDLARKI
jgi:murein DD-endopeptidase MepM/ murein hydrolase activator NlpD